jgi:hypothetical protein
MHENQKRNAWTSLQRPDRPSALGMAPLTCRIDREHGEATDQPKAIDRERTELPRETLAVDAY